MQWTFNCILLVSIAAIAASDSDVDEEARMKRDLSFLKSLVSTAFGGAAPEESPKIMVRKSDNYKLFRVPGFEKILVKAVPKGSLNVGAVSSAVPSEELGVAENPSMAIVNSYLGTKRLNDTLLALQGVKNLLQSGILEAQREGSLSLKPGAYPTVMAEPGKIVIDGVVQDAYPLPMIEGYRPVEIMRLPDLPIPSKFSYKQVSKGGVTSYTAKDNKNVIVSETHKPQPLPSYLTSRIQEVMYLGTHRLPGHKVPIVATGFDVPPPISVYEVPKVKVTSPIKVMPTYVSSGVEYHQVHTPHVHLTPPPVKVATHNVPGGYSYSTIHSDGSVTNYSGSGQVVEQKGARPSVVIAETSRPAPLPVFLTNRIEKVAATAMVAKMPGPVPHVLYESPVVYREPYPVVVEERPTVVYDHVGRLTHGTVNPYSRPLYREDVNAHFAKHKNHHHSAPSSNGPSGYSYKTVHSDGSVSTYTDSEVTEEGAKKVLVKEGPMFYPAQLPTAYSYHNVYQPHLVKEEICLDPPAHHANVVHEHVEHSKPSGYSYKTVHGNGVHTTYSGSGHVDHEEVASPLTSPLLHPVPPVMVPELVTPGEFFSEDFDGGKKVMFAQPVLSQYVYKQINHNNPNEISVADVGPVSLNGEVNVKVGPLPVPSPAPFNYVTPAAPQKLPDLPSVTPKGPSEYVYVPPADVNEPLPTRAPPVESSHAESSHSFTHVTSDGVHTNKGGAASFESAKTNKVVKVVKTSSSTSTSRTRTKPKLVKTVRVSTPRIRVTSPAPTTPNDQLSLSANPIVVLPDEPSFSFKQDRADGSSITVVGNKKNVSVIEDNRTDNDHHRGDIPSTSQ